MKNTPPRLDDRLEHDLPAALLRGGIWVCATCGCKLDQIPAMRRREFVHRQGTEGRDAGGCRVSCIGSIHRG